MPNKPRVFGLIRHGRSAQSPILVDNLLVADQHHSDSGEESILVLIYETNPIPDTFILGSSLFNADIAGAIGTGNIK